MLSRVKTVCFSGINVISVDVEVHFAKGQPGITIVGLGDKAVKESIDRIRASLSSIGVILPPQRITINLAPADIIKEGVALVTEDRKVTGLNLSGTVNDNITMVAIKKALSNGLYSSSIARKLSAEYIDKLKIKTPSGDQIVGNLSGGNQQKVVISKWLLNDPDVIIMDEPTRGIDVGAKRDIYLLIGDLVQHGKAVILISSEIPELMGVCDRIAVMAEGHFAGEISREQFSQETIMRLASDIAV